MPQNERKREQDLTESATHILEGMAQGEYVELILAAGQWMHVLQGNGKEAMARRCQRSESGAVTEYVQLATGRNKPQMTEAVKVLARMIGTSQDAPREQQETFGKVAPELLSILAQQDPANPIGAGHALDKVLCEIRGEEPPPAPKRRKAARQVAEGQAGEPSEDASSQVSGMSSGEAGEQSEEQSEFAFASASAAHSNNNAAAESAVDLTSEAEEGLAERATTLPYLRLPVTHDLPDTPLSVQSRNTRRKLVLKPRVRVRDENGMTMTREEYQARREAQTKDRLEQVKAKIREAAKDMTANRVELLKYLEPSIDERGSTKMKLKQPVATLLLVNAFNGIALPTELAEFSQHCMRMAGFVEEDRELREALGQDFIKFCVRLLFSLAVEAPALGSTRKALDLADYKLSEIMMARDPLTEASLKKATNSPNCQNRKMQMQANMVPPTARHNTASSQGRRSGQRQGQRRRAGGQRPTGKQEVCRRFANTGECRFGKGCRFDKTHKCGSCGALTHGTMQCPKLGF